MDKRDKAKQNFLNGYNCCQAVVGVFCDELGLDFDTVTNICEYVKRAAQTGTQIGLVVGGGNFWRGRSSGTMNRTRADNMGMLATVMNSLALCEALEQLGVKARVMSSVAMQPIAEPFTARDAVKHLEEGEVVIFGCGTGCPFFSTDTTAALRAAEIEADVIFKATNVDGVYDKDPNKFDDAVKFDNITFQEVITRDLKVMDSTAFSLCKDNDMPIIVFNLNDPDNIMRVVSGEKIGTTVSNNQ